MAYYYIDDVNIYCCDIDTGDTTSTPPPSYPEILLTPNPNSGTMQLSGSFAPGTRIEFFDALGRLVRREDVAEGNTLQTISVPQLAEGLYLYRVVSGEQELKRGKVILAR